MLQSEFDADITYRITFIQTFFSTLASEEAGLYSHHCVSTLEFELHKSLDLNLSFVWDYPKILKRRQTAWCRFVAICG